MKTIGLLGGTAWSSTIGYYKALNELVGTRLGGFHSAKILLKSIDYHDIMTHYGKDHDKVAALLKMELLELIRLNPECIVICCNSLHKYYDQIKQELQTQIPFMHAVELVAEHLHAHNQKSVLLLATTFTMEDGFFARILEQKGISVTIPVKEEREQMEKIHDALMYDNVSEDSKDYFANLIKKHNNLDAVVLGCTEFPMLVSAENSVLPIVDPIALQVKAAVDFALNTT